MLKFIYLFTHLFLFLKKIKQNKKQPKSFISSKPHDELCQDRHFHELSRLTSSLSRLFQSVKHDIFSGERFSYGGWKR